MINLPVSGVANHQTVTLQNGFKLSLLVDSLKHVPVFLMFIQ